MPTRERADNRPLKRRPRRVAPSEETLSPPQITMAGPEFLERTTIPSTGTGSAAFTEYMGIPEPTGGYIVLLEEGASPRAAVAALHNATGLRAATSSDFSTAAAAQEMSSTQVVVLEALGTAVIRPGASGEGGAMMAAIRAEGAVIDVRPEFYMYAVQDWDQRRRAWLHEGLSLLIDAKADFEPLLGQGGSPARQAMAEATWGLQAIGVLSSQLTGRGIKVAVLDTGIDMTHPDFQGRNIERFDFTGGNDPTDRQGHGTHVAGTLAGLAQPSSGAPRYGVAPEVDLSVYKVLNDRGRGEEGRIQEAMEAAIRAGNVVLNMSLGRPSTISSQPDAVYERIGAAALNLGSLVVAAAGNESARRLGHIAPVGYPANSPSILAVAAFDPNFGVADFSCGGLVQNGGEVDIAAPGVDVFSSAPLPRRFVSLSGTSMAAPHVAGLAALLAQSDHRLRGRALFDAVVQQAKPGRPPNTRDLGKGYTHI